MKVKCKCGYEWDCNSKLMKVSCPSCGSKVIRENKNAEKNKTNK